jgi:hypothetical protein
MQTPPSTPPRTPTRTPTRTPVTPPRTPGTPKMTPEKSPISCRGLLFPGRRGIGKAKSPAKSPPLQLKKPQKMRPLSEVYKWLPLLKLMLINFCSNLLGKGDFGTVSEVCLPNIPGTPRSPPIAVKEIKFDTHGVCSTDLQEEVNRLGSPGCVHGVACRTGESVKIFMPLGIQFESLDFSIMTKEMLEWVIQTVNDICMNKLDLGLLADIKLENFIFLPEGTATVVKDAEGQPSMGPPTEHDEIVYCDLGSVDPTSGGTKKYGVFPLVESDAEKADFETKLRTFKATVMEALIRDAANPSGKTVEQIVAPLVPPKLVYAAGVQHQTQGFQLQLRF